MRQCAKTIAASVTMALVVSAATLGSRNLQAEQRKDSMPRVGQTVESVVRPSIDSVSCSQFNSRLMAKSPAKGAVNPAVAEEFLIYLRQVGADMGAQIVEVAPREFAWWLHVLGPVSALTVTMAIHETSHDVDQYLRICGDGTARYRIGVDLFASGIRRGESPTIASSLTQGNSRALHLMTEIRRRKYVFEAASGNDITSLFGELTAYLGEADTEIALYRRHLSGERMMAPGVTAINGGLSGLIDMTVLMKVYLQALQRDDPAAFERVFLKTNVSCLISRAHADSRDLVNRAVELDIQRRLGFDIGLSRLAALRFAELVEVGSRGGGIYADIKRRAAVSKTC